MASAKLIKAEKPANHPLRSWRKAQKPAWTLTQIAKRIPCTVAQLSSIEHGYRLPSLVLAWKLAQITGLSMEQFVTPKVRRSAAGRIL